MQSKPALRNCEARSGEQNNRNNHPIRAGQVIGTHNGTIYNADELFRRFRLTRGAEVDSELLIRLADAAVRDGSLDAETFLRLVAPGRGQISAVLAAVGAPGRVVVLKGNKPLEFRYSRRHRAVAYATDAAVLDDAIEASAAPRDLVMPEAEGDWDVVQCELITFADPARDLPPLDRLEGFRPDGHGLYRRALVATRANTGVEAARVYHMARVRRGERLRGGVWTEE